MKIIQGPCCSMPKICEEECLCWAVHSVRMVVLAVKKVMEIVWVMEHGATLVVGVDE